MRNIILWAKGNPITVASVLAVLVCVPVLFVFVHSGGAGFVSQMQQWDAKLGRLASLRRSTVTVPAANPGGRPMVVPTIINPAVVESMQTLYGQMNEQVVNIFQRAVEFNQRGHLLMVDGLFPRMTDQARVFEARSRYLDLLQSILQPYSPEATFVRLNAGRPLAREQVNAELTRIETDFLAKGVFPPVTSSAKLSPQQVAELRTRQKRSLVDAMIRNARSMHLYAETDYRSSAFPFPVDRWALATDATPPEVIWESQLNLWIIQDVAEAIARTNSVSDPSFNVLSAPVKRLLRVEPLPGYVGINSPGGLATDGGARGPMQPGFGGESFGDGGAGDSFGRSGPGFAAMPAAPGIGPAGPRVIERGTTLKEANQPLPRDYSVSPTGRRSNVLYDVRHLRVSLLIDAQRTPELLDNLSRVNYMTVLQVQVTGIDEHAAMLEGYVYGPGDVVQLDMLLESIWLRDWTAQLMPDNTLSLLQPPPSPAP